MKKLFLVSVVALATVGFVSCEKDEVDNEAPVIKLIAPEDDEPIKPGSEIHFEVNFSDNVALGTYKVNIHGAFDGHSHNHAVTRIAGDSAIFEKTWLEQEFIAAGESPISGKRATMVHHHKIVIPTEINKKPLKSGHYHFMVYCTDKAGIESFTAREIFISYDAKEHDHHHH